MKAIYIACLGLLLINCTVTATPLPFVEEMEKALQGDISARTPASLPEPAALETDWWRYFEVKDQTLQQRVQALLRRLDALPGELSPEAQTAARPLLQLIRLNLQALPRARAQPTPTPPPPRTHREDYTLSQLITIAEQLRNLQLEQRAEQADIAVAERAIRSTSRRIDTLMAAYLGLASGDPSRLVRGLEIMAEHSATEVAKERLRVRKASAAADAVLANQLADEQRIATQRLVARASDAEVLDQAIERAQGRLRETQERLMSEQSRALSVVGDSPEERATERNRQQRLVQASVEEAIAQARLLRLQAEKQLVKLLLPEGEVNAENLQRLLNTWETQLTAIRRQALTWINRSERERQRAGDLVAVAPAENPVVTSVRLINEERLRLAQETLVALQRLDDELTQTELVLQLVEEKLTQREGGPWDWWLRFEYLLTQLADKTEDWITTSLFKIGDTPVTALGLLRVMLILTLAWWLSHWLRRALTRFGEHRENIDCAALYVVGRLSHYVLVIIGFIVGLSSIGVDFTNFALVAGAIAIGIGFGLQSIVNNFVSGLILLFERSLKVGDFIELASGIAGEVREINVRSTLINTNDNIDIVVPNSEFMNTKVINWTLSEGYCRVHLPFRIAYGTDKDKVRQAGLEAAEKLPHTLRGVPGKNPGVWLVRFGESCLEFELVVWLTPRAVKRPGAVRAAYMWEIDSALRRYGIEPPFPQRDLHLRSGFAGLLGSDMAVDDSETEAKLGVVLEKR